MYTLPFIVGAAANYDNQHANNIKTYIQPRDSMTSTPNGGVPGLDATLGGAAEDGSTRNRGAPVLDRPLKDGSGGPDLNHQMWERRRCTGERRHLRRR